MNRQNVLKSIFFSLLFSSLTSCGLIEKFKTPEQPTDSNSTVTATSDSNASAGTDDLFSKTLNEPKEESMHVGTDAPTNITEDKSATQEDLKSLEDEFSGNVPKEVAVTETTPTETAPVDVAATVAEETESKQVKVEESLPEIKSEVPEKLGLTDDSDAGKILKYKVQKGETLMQIAFKIYGDISKWKVLKEMNNAKFSKNSALRKNMELKYTAPSKEFVWNPEGTPYMIKNGETLGTISNSVYKTPKKWKKIWENNKPLITNPNIIYAGFTLYYKGDNMANYVQPKAIQRKLATKSKTRIESSKDIEEVKVEQAISNLEQSDSNEIDLTKEVQSSTIRDVHEEIKANEAQDEALVH